MISEFTRKRIEAGFAEQMRDGSIGVTLCSQYADGSHCSVNPYSLNVSQKVDLVPENNNTSFPGAYSFKACGSETFRYACVSADFHQSVTSRRGTISSAILYNKYTDIFLEGTALNNALIVRAGFFTMFKIPALSISLGISEMIVCTQQFFTGLLKIVLKNIQKEKKNNF